MKIVKLTNGDKLSANSIEKNIISVKLSDHFTKTIVEHEIIPLGIYYDKIGSKLSISNGKIVIGEGVNYVKISGQVGILSANNAKQISARIYRDETTMLDTVKCDVQNYETLAMGTRLVKVTPGQTLSLRVRGAIGTIISSASITYITVEVVD